MADLFDLGDLPKWLQVPEVDQESAVLYRRAVNGWLQDATGLPEWPDPLPDRLWAWAVELAAIVCRNPAAALSERVDDYEYRADRARRAEILAEVRRAYPQASAGPQWSFPEPDWTWR